MAETITIPHNASKEELYASLVSQVKYLVADETDAIANIANVMAVLKYSFNFLWVGVYIVKENELVLGPFQGPLACTRIQKGKGVCGSAWLNKETIIVPNVHEFPGHIACSSLSQSEIVIPGFNSNGQVSFVLDVDAEQLNAFDQIDAFYLSQMVEVLQNFV